MTSRRLRLAQLAQDSDVLRTWGEICATLKVCERTAREWHRRHGLPVFKPTGASNNTVVASRSAVLAWLTKRCAA